VDYAVLVAGFSGAVYGSIAVDYLREKSWWLGFGTLACVAAILLDLALPDHSKHDRWVLYWTGPLLAIALAALLIDRGRKRSRLASIRRDAAGAEELHKGRR
jgi:drug/metabolite transporter (DMT)-like permease